MTWRNSPFILRTPTGYAGGATNSAQPMLSVAATARFVLSNPSSYLAKTGSTGQQITPHQQAAPSGDSSLLQSSAGQLTLLISSREYDVPEQNR